MLSGGAHRMCHDQARGTTAMMACVAWSRTATHAAETTHHGHPQANLVQQRCKKDKALPVGAQDDGVWERRRSQNPRRAGATECVEAVEGWSSHNPRRAWATEAATCRHAGADG